MPLLSVLLLPLLSTAPAEAAPTETANLPPRLRLETPPDPNLSPYTGYTRAHWLEITERLLAGVLPYCDTPSGMPALPPPAGETAFHAAGTPENVVPVSRQAFERIMMLSVIYTAATGRDRVPGYEGSISEPFRRGMIHALDPASPHHWGPPARGEHAGSVFVFGAQFSPRFFWEPFTPAQKAHILDYLGELAAARSYDNNHYYFHLTPVPFLETHGRKADRAHHTAMLERLFNWYRGDGWFIDGSNLAFDKYNAWGFHLYNQAVYRLDPAWRDRFGDRIRQATTGFLETYPYLIGRDGGPVPWGRSLSYRFAELAALGWASWNGLNPLAPGEARRVASGVLRYFWEHGAQDADGLLQVGFRGTNAAVAEFYNGPGTSYWAAQGLIALLIPADDPFWTAPEEPMPADHGRPAARVIRGAGMVAHVRADGEARLYPVRQPFSRAHQHWQRGVKYQQHAYSSALGWCALGEGTDLGAGRTGVSLDGESWSYRDHARAIALEADHVASAWGFDVDLTYQPAVDDRYELITHTLIAPSGEVHVFWHESPQPVYLHLGGFGIPAPTTAAVSTEDTDGALVVRTPGYFSSLRVLQAPEGRLTHEVLSPRPGWEKAHLFDTIGTYPVWRSRAPVPANTPVVIHVDGGRDRAPAAPEVRVARERGRLVIQLDGATHEIPTAW